MTDEERENINYTKQRTAFSGGSSTKGGYVGGGLNLNSILKDKSEKAQYVRKISKQKPYQAWTNIV